MSLDNNSNLRQKFKFITRNWGCKQSHLTNLLHKVKLSTGLSLKIHEKIFENQKFGHIFI